MRVLVLGSGLIGTASAWYLRAAGHEVRVVDRQQGSGLETSFANAGQISVSHAEPWANPAAPAKVAKWLLRADAPLRFRPRADWHQWHWAFEFLRNCSAGRTRTNMAQIVRLGLYSRATLQALRRETGIEYDCLTRGILHFFTDRDEFEAAHAPADTMRALGCDLTVLDRAAAVRLEPALAAVGDRLVGGLYAESDESGDAFEFTRRLAAMAASRGVVFEYGTTLAGLDLRAGAMAGVEVIRADGGAALLQADAYLVALGSYTAPLLRTVGIDTLIYPAKGYSVTLPLADTAIAPTVSLTDDEFKLAFSRLGNRLRVAGTAELNGFNLELDSVRCQAIVRRVMDLFPGIADVGQAAFWTGLRPATPSNVPYIGKTRFAGLYVNAGHGTLGWTHACGSGRAIAEIVDGRVPEVDFGFTGLGLPALGT